MSFAADIDIDLPRSFNPTKLFPWTQAIMVKDEEIRQHPCGVYPQKIPIDPITNLAAIPYEQAEELGYIKIDFLHLNHLDLFQSREEIEALIEKEPDWGLLQIDSVHPKLFQLSKHGDLLKRIKPKSIEELADVLALIRPGKKQFEKLYMTNRENVRKVLWIKGEDGFSFKHSHGIAYALNIVLQLHLIEAGAL